MTEGLVAFRTQMDRIIAHVGTSAISSKVQRYIRAYQAGLPQDITVRWFSKDDVAGIEGRIEELTSRGLEVWISQGLPANRDIDQQLSSVEKRTDLIKGLKSLDDFRGRGLSHLQQWDAGSWAKVFYDTPQRALTSGTLRIDTNRKGASYGADLRTLRLEAAAGISDIRDLDRQMSARHVIVVHPNKEIAKQIEEALQVFGYQISVLDPREALPAIWGIVHGSKPVSDAKAKPSEPRVILLDFTTFPEQSVQIARQLKGDKDGSCIPIIPLVDESSDLPHDVQAMVASAAPLKSLQESVRLSTFLTGFRLSGGPQGLQLPILGVSIQRDLDAFLRTVLGTGWTNLHRMVEIANVEERPTIAFEFKIVPADPYDFFFLDYEWSGPKDPFHRFDWAYTFGDAG